MNELTLIEGHKAIDPPAGVPIWQIDPYDPDVLIDAPAFFRELHDKGDFAYLSKYSMLICGGYEVTREVFSDHERFVSSRGVGVSDFKLQEPWRPPSIVLEVDPPAHNRTRRVIMRALSPKVVRDLRDAFQADAETLINTVQKKQEIDAVTDIAEAFSTSVFPRAVGIKYPDSRRLIDYGAMVFNALGPDNALRQKMMAKAPDIAPWINNACKRENLTEGGIGAAIHAASDQGEITEAEAEMLVRS
ncbi:MAG: cytochrome P450, partial [Pikeienuella sp.]